MKMQRRIYVPRPEGEQKDGDEVGLLRRSRPGPTYRMPIVLGRREWFKRLRKVVRGSPARAGNTCDG